MGHGATVTGLRQSLELRTVHSLRAALGVGGGSKEVAGPGAEQELAKESRGGRRLSSRVFVNGRVWGFHFLCIPDEQGAVTTAEGGEMLQELISGDTWHLWTPFRELLLCVSNPRGVLFSFCLLFLKITNLAYSALNSEMFFLFHTHTLTSLIRNGP